MMMIDKVKKYLLRHDEINVYKKNESGSEYYRVGNSIIRVSNHIPISNNQPDVLNIVVSGDNFVVMYGNRIINVNDYNEFKTFLKYHIKMCDCFKDLINAGLGRKSNDYIAQEAKKKKAAPKPADITPLEKRVDGISVGPQPGNYIFEKAHFESNSLAGITEEQLDYLEGKPMKSHKCALRFLSRLRKRNKKNL